MKMQTIFRSVVAAALMTLLGPQALAGGELLALRANNAAALPGASGAFTIRTYSSRPVNQGQVCIRVRQRLRAGVSNPIASIDEAIVFGHNDDPNESAILDTDGGDQIIMLQFSSKISAINAVDGPLAVIYFTTDNNALPGDRFDLEFDFANTSLIDDNGQQIPLELRDGRLDIRGIGEPVSLAAAGEPVFSGEVAFLSVQTNEPFPIAAGLVGLRYNERFFPQPPKIVIDSRYGNANHNVIFSGNGLLVISFDSIDSSLNTVPGDIVSIRLVSNRLVQPGVESPIWLEPMFSFLWDPNGVTIPVELEGDAVRFR